MGGWSGGQGRTESLQPYGRTIPEFPRLYEATHQPPGSTYAEEAMEPLRRALERLR